MMLLGGLTAADTSRADVLIATPANATSAGTLPTALHDTAAVRLGRAVYLFGGGTGANTQSNVILRIPAAGGAVTVAGHLPAPSSDQSATAIDGTAYIVGGFTGTSWLDTIVAWRPGSPARIVARLPFPVRYAAVSSAAGRLVIAGGSLENATASRAVLAFTPPHGRVGRIGQLPAPTTHAAAAPIGQVVYVIGGRGANVSSFSARIVAVDLRTGRIAQTGVLSSPRSDVAAVSLGNRILLAGGRGAAGAEAGLSLLRAGHAPTAAGSSATTAGKRWPATPQGDVYAFDGANMLTGAAKLAKPLVYVPNSESGTVDVIDPSTYRVVEHFTVGLLPQHVVPSWDLKTLYVTNDDGNSLTPIDPETGAPGTPISVEDPYNLYFTPNGQYAIVVAERLGRLDFRDPHTFALHHSLQVPCLGVDHMDFTADGSFLLASCEFSGQMIVVDVAEERVVRTIELPGGGGTPQDVKLAPDGRIFYVADMHANGVWEISAKTFHVVGFLATGAGAHGLYPSRNAKYLYVTNRSAGSISVVSFGTRKVVATWTIPGGGSPDMGGVSANGNVLWGYASGPSRAATRSAIPASSAEPPGAAPWARGAL
jgi:YVTN family beta-propeller protein